ncbi:Stp1/IreP family PP2C-type Ser/Thr phosphatase [Desulfuromonas sp. AOP6]|uniref:Stp1/IreP family PP2C-type Ser/Thr phosphatase n=1 Tax=Desulfuromonas sp. AOP6 TaxID=1566351 RepID=UPI00128A445F|nr:Stp1/IreP family PP2C-type Ser/Thr phosphatase [Desulfuromonas sp. AOP6]BCA80350.1 serine/threonine phosphatase [Desulfuromonas sp. AOP6]
MRLLSWGQTDQGLLRENNEDSFILSPERGLFVVADGMGGYAAGEVASSLAVREVQKFLQDLDQGKAFADMSADEALRQAFLAADEAVSREARDNPGWRGMGCTLVTAWIQGERMTVAHVGDSRLYRVRQGSLELLTEDHTLVHEQVLQGLLSPADATVSPNRHVLTRALGSFPNTEVSVAQFTIEEDDRYLLCTDGLTDMLDDETILSLVLSTDDPRTACARLVDAANAAGGKDNITAVLFFCQPNGISRFFKGRLPRFRR